MDDANDMTELADLTDPMYWGEVFEVTAIETEWTAEQQAEWDAIYYALDPAAVPLNDDFTTT